MQTTTAPPTRPSAAALIEAVQLAQRALDDALIDDLDTAGPRAALGVAREALAAAQAADAQEAAAAAAAERRAAEDAAAAALTEAEETFVAAVEVIKPAPDADAPPVPGLPPMVALATKELARARAAFASAQVPYRAAIEKRNAVQARIDAKQRELDAINARRIAGDEQPGDPVAMTALVLDLEGLAKMLAPLVAAAEGIAPTGHQQAVQMAEAALAKAKVSAELDAMVARLRAVEQHFIAQVRTLRLEAQKRGHNNFGSVFVASDALRKVSNGAWV